ncbi:MAG: glycoside hydrolase [Cyclobacteriaceae bacterium]|nr:glycoside hydrolase [Cyclobacteriaceae bacterium]
MNRYTFFTCIILKCMQLSFSGLSAQSDGASTWPFEIQTIHKPGTYWWVPGSAFDSAGIDWNLEQMHKAGIGTAHIIPIYGARGYEDRYIQYLSKEWMDMLHYAAHKTDELGMQLDMTTGTGWCFGGPDLPHPFQDMRIQWNPLAKDISFDSIRGVRMVKRPAPGGEGAMLNSFSPEAMEHYLKRFDSAFAQYSGKLPRAQYHDSYEYSGNWSPDLYRQFKSRRGYSLEDNLSFLFEDHEGNQTDKQKRIKYDYRRTLAELHLEYIQKWSAWSSSRGMLTRNQAHGSPANLLDVYAAADIPEIEMFGSPTFPIPGFRHEDPFVRKGDNNPIVMKMAASAAHIMKPEGRQWVTSESFTWLRENWHGNLAQMKLSADLFFLAGVNHMFYHGNCYSPPDVEWPGWFFYASTKADPRNSIWRDIPALNAYIARCQSMLQAGRHDNDLLVYWPIHDLWMASEGLRQNLTVHDYTFIKSQSIGRVATSLQEKGYSFDLISDDMIKKLKVSNGRITAPGGTYKAVVVPEALYMPAETLARLAALAEAGIPVVFESQLPIDVPGMSQLKAHRKQFSKAMKKASKRLAVDVQPAIWLENNGVTREEMTDMGLHFIRRMIDDAHWYFIANNSEKDIDQWVPLTISGTQVHGYDPMNGKAYNLISKENPGGTMVYLQIPAGASVIIQVGKQNNRKNIFPYEKADNAGIPLKGTWNIRFVEGGPVLLAAYSTEKLESWTMAEDTMAQAYAGTALYTLEFDKLVNSDADGWLFLGDVRESARARLNGHDLGTLISLPFKVRIPSSLWQEKNRLEIEVTNLSANRIRYLERMQVPWKIMHDANIVTIHYDPVYTAGEWPVLPSGLLGPVEWVPVKSFLPE